MTAANVAVSAAPAAPSAPLGLARLVPVAVPLIVLLVAITTITPWPVGAFEDDAIYTVLGRALATGEGFRLTNLPGAPHATHFPPGYPFVLSLLWRISPEFPDNIVVFKFANAVFLACAAFAIWYFGRTRLGMSTLAAAAAAIVSTLSVVVLLLTGVVMSEPLFMALLLPALALAERGAETGSWRTSAAAGLAVGALALVRTLGAFAVPAALVVLLARRQFRAALAFALAAAALLVPWQLWVGAHQHEVASVLAGKYGAYGPWLADGYREGGWPLVRDVLLRNLEAAYGSLSYIVLPVRAEWPRVLAFVALMALGGAGLVLLRRRAPVTALFIAIYVGVVLAWPFDPNRFLWAIWPLLVLALWQSGDRAIRHARSADARRLPRIAALGSLAAALCLATGYAVHTVRGYRGQWWASIQRDAGQRARPIVEWIARNTAMTDVVATDHDLIVYLYAGRTATPVTTFVPVERIRPLTPEEEVAAMRRILAASAPRFVIVGTGPGIASANALAAGDAPALRRVGDTGNALVFEVLRRAAGPP